jgi:hypothetical protein
VSGVDYQQAPEPRRWEFTSQVCQKVNGHRFTAPNGGTFDVYGATHRDHTAQSLVEWGYEQADLEKQVCTKLGLAKFVHSWERPREPQGDQLLRVCAICRAEQVTHGGKMALHGYRRPGWGRIEGECFSVAFDAYKLSHEACDAFLRWSRQPGDAADDRGVAAEAVAGSGGISSPAQVEADTQARAPQQHALWFPHAA